jgi:hypothetical protein
MSFHYVADVHLGPSRAGLTLTLAFANRDHTNNAGCSGVVTEVGGGDYDLDLLLADPFQGYVRVKNGSTILGSWAIDPRDTNADIKTSTVSGGGGGDPLGNLVPGTYLPGTAGAVLGALVTDDITLLTPGTLGGTLQLIIGQSYGGGTAPAIVDTLRTTDPDLTGATVTLEVGAHTGTPFLSAAVDVSGPTSAQVLSTTLTSVQTAALPETRSAQWAYWADWGGTPAVRVCLRSGPAFLLVVP